MPMNSVPWTFETLTSFYVEVFFEVESIPIWTLANVGRDDLTIKSDGLTF